MYVSMATMWQNWYIYSLVDALYTKSKATGNMDKINRTRQVSRAIQGLPWTASYLCSSAGTDSWLGNMASCWGRTVSGLHIADRWREETSAVTQSIHVHQ